jgi:hypothetical protein
MLLNLNCYKYNTVYKMSKGVLRKDANSLFCKKSSSWSLNLEMEGRNPERL